MGDAPGYFLHISGSAVCCCVLNGSGEVYHQYVGIGFSF